jgi:hypothetical protein
MFNLFCSAICYVVQVPYIAQTGFFLQETYFQDMPKPVQMFELLAERKGHNDPNLPPCPTSMLL